MLLLKPNCERCDRDLSPSDNDAFICSFECTFCQNCTRDIFHGECPNCGGELLQRPARPAKHLTKHPGSTERLVKPHP